MQRYTYRVLRELLNKMTDEQLNCDVTIEDGIADECFSGELRITDNEHDHLDGNHPVIFFNSEEPDWPREHNAWKIAARIGL